MLSGFLRAKPAILLQWKRHVFGDGHAVEESGILEDVAETSALVR